MRYLRKLMRFTAGYYWQCTLAGTLLYCVAPLTLGLAARAFFDAITNDGDGVWIAVAFIVALQLGEIASEMWITRTWSGFMLKTHSLLQRNLLAGILRGYGTHGLAVAPGDALSRFRDDPQVITMGSMDGVADLIGRGSFAVVAVFVMGAIDPVLTIAAFAPVIVGSLVSDALGTRGSRYGAAALQSATNLSRFLGELVGAQLAVRVAGAEQRVVNRLTDIGEIRRRLSLKDRVFMETINSMNYHLVHVSTGAVLLLGASRIRDGSFTVGDFALFVIFLDQLQFLPAEIGRVLYELKRTEVSMQRMGALVPGEPPAALVRPAPVYLRERDRLPALDPPPERIPLQRLDVEGLTALHRSSGRGVHDVSFTIERGTCTVVTGRVGAGKTTLLQAVLGLIPRAAGTIRWNGEVVDHPAAFLVPPQTAFTPQVPRLFSETLVDNLLLGLAPTADIDAAVRAAVLEDDVASFDRGLGTLVGPRGVKLSGGQVQRAAAARMFVRAPELLVFDDLSSALDATTEAELWRRLFTRGDETTCLVVSHSAVARARADQVLVLEDGLLAQ